MVFKYIIVLTGIFLIDLFSKNGFGVNAIYNGQISKRNKFLWVAQIRSDSGDLLCHGALISGSWVLGLASCVKNAAVRDVVVGDFNRTVDGDGEEVATVKRIILHPSHSFFYNNLALLELSSSVNVSSESIEPITRFSTADIDSEIVTSKRKCQIAGWGETLQSGSWKTSNVLQELKVVKEDESVCAQLGLVGMGYYYCFKMGKFHSGPCFKDNGTPVVYKVYGKRILIGLIYGQFSVDGCIGGVKIVSRASNFKSWVAQYVPDIQ